MNWLLTAVFASIVLGLLVEGLIWRERIYHFPFLAAVMTFAFILPQIPGAAADPFLPEGDYTKTIFMAILCLLALRLGWSESARPLAMFRIAFSERRLLIVAGLFSAIGAFFYVRLSHLPGDLSIGVQMSGLPVVYLFIARLLSYGLLIALFCFARRPSPVSVIIILADLALYCERILITGKRAEATELLLMMLLPLWFYRKWLAPRWAVVVVLVAGTFAMFSMGDYRQITRANSGLPSWEELSQIDVTANFTRLIETGGLEFRNAVFRIAATDRNMEFDYGAFHWNRLVWTYVPAQIVGSGFKDSLMMTLPSPGRDYNPAAGTTETGLVDAFQSFWYFGALKFFLLSYLMARIWRSAVEGWTAAQMTYALSIVPAMHAMSHETDWVMPIWVHMMIFLVPALYFCAVPSNSRRERRSAVARPNNWLGDASAGGAR